MPSANQVFAVPVFFIVFRETVETSIVVAVLLAFIKQTLGSPNDDKVIYKRLCRQVWVGTLGGLLACLIIGAGMIGAFYGIGKDVWSGTENLWEGIFSLIACIVITIMGAAILRVNKLQAKWQTKLTAALTAEKTTGVAAYSKKYAMLFLPLITVLREGLEAIVFIGGVSFANPASSFPLPVVIGLIAGSFVGYCIYKGGDTVKLQYFLIGSTCLLYLVAAGLLSKAAWAFDTYNFEVLTGGAVGESGAGPGSYDIRRSVWHVNCCSPTSGASGSGGGWGIFNSILGWQNSATYQSVVWYNVYWIFVSVFFIVLRFHEKNGHYPFTKAKAPNVSSDEESATMRVEEFKEVKVGAPAGAVAPKAAVTEVREKEADGDAVQRV